MSIIVGNDNIYGKPDNLKDVIFVGCGGHFNILSGSFFSKNYPDNHPPNKDCIWNITVPNSYHVEFVFDDFYVDDESPCSDDYVAVSRYKYDSVM